jgi:NADPH:quinone reductase-like Zn-dependent oxidoreductase
VDGGSVSHNNKLVAETNDCPGENDGRKLGPTMTEDEWGKALIRQGFSGLDVYLRDFNDSRDYLCSFMASTASPMEHSNLSCDILVIHSPTVSEETTGLSDKLINHFSTSKSSVAAVSIQEVTPSILDGKACIVLAEIDSPIVKGIGQAGFEAIRNLALRSAGVLWVTRGGAMNSPIPEANLIVGLARSIRSEHAGVTFATLDLDVTSSLAAEGTVDAIVRLCGSVFSPQAGKAQDCEFSLQNGVLFNCRITAQKEMNDMLAGQNKLATPVLLPFYQPSRPLKLEVGVPGILDTLQFVDDFDAVKPLAEDEVEIKVMASGLNFVDIMVAMGQVPDTMIGAECSGIVSRIGSSIANFKPGDRVMTWKLGCHQTYVRSPGVMFQRLPDEMTFEVAASIPTIYCTSYHALYDCARLRRGESILIHAAAGGVGQSAIILAKHLGAEIFATVGSEEKRQLIMSQYGIPDDHIFDSRNLSFASGIKRMTQGRGVDVVLNSLAGEALRETWHCLAMFGRFVEIGKKDIVGNTGLDMAPFMDNRMFACVNLVGIYRHNIPLASRLLSDVMDLVHQGVIRPITPITVYPYSQIESAFKLMQLGQHVGKIVLKPSDDDLVPVSRLGGNSAETKLTSYRSSPRVN